MFHYSEISLFSFYKPCNSVGKKYPSRSSSSIFVTSRNQKGCNKLEILVSRYWSFKVGRSIFYQFLLFYFNLQHILSIKKDHTKTAKFVFKYFFAFGWILSTCCWEPWVQNFKGDFLYKVNLENRSLHQYKKSHFVPSFMRTLLIMCLFWKCSSKLSNSKLQALYSLPVSHLHLQIFTMY